MSAEPTPPTPPTMTGPPERPRPLRSITASATRLTSTKLKGRSSGQDGRGDTSWQDDAWEMFDLVGELRFLSSTLANRMGQAKLYVGRLPEDLTEEPVALEEDDEGSALSEVLANVSGLQGGLSQIITRLGINLFIPGEGWLVGIPQHLIERLNAPEGSLRLAVPPPALAEVDLGDLDWRMLSTSEVNINAAGEVTLTLGTRQDEQIKVDPDDIYLIRVWRPHPRRSWESDSPARSSLPVLRELVGLTMHISAQIDSRLAGAGLLIVPQSAQQALRTSLGLAEDDPTDPFTEALIEAMVTPISDRSSASAVVPLVVVVPDEVADKFNFMTFATPLDTEAKEMRDETIRRLALGMDANPELLLGTAGVSHWGAWLVQEDVITTHVEPPLALICDALTTQYLWPVMEALGYSPDDAREYVIWYDVSHLIMRPNRASDAMSLHEKGVISDESLRDATGFSDDDAPPITQDTPTDAAVTLAFDMVRASPGLAANPGLPTLVAQIRQVMDPEAPLPGVDAPEGESPAEPPADGAEGQEEPQDGGLPDTADDDAPTDDIGRPPAAPANIAASGRSRDGWSPGGWLPGLSVTEEV